MLPEGRKRGVELLPYGRSSLKRKSMGEPWIRRNKQTRDLGNMLYAEKSAKVREGSRLDLLSHRKQLALQERSL